MLFAKRTMHRNTLQVSKVFTDVVRTKTPNMNRERSYDQGYENSNVEQIVRKTKEALVIQEKEKSEQESGSFKNSYGPHSKHRDGTRTDICNRVVHSEGQRGRHQHVDSKNSDRSSLVAGIPPIITCPEIRKVSTKEFNMVVFDLETSFLGNDAEICQIAATDGLDEFNVYVFPQHGISPGASKVNKMRIEGGVLFQGNCPVSAVDLNEAVLELLKWLNSKTPCVLVAHNARRFDAKHLFKAVVSCNASKEFSEKVLGFSDTLNAFKEYSPERKSFSQPCLVKDLLGTTYNAHNALDDVRALQQLVSKFLSDEILRRHSFTVFWFNEYTSFLKQKAENLKTLEPLIRSGAISQGIADRAAASGLVFGHMIHAFQDGGVDGLRGVLTETFHGKPRVTKNERILTQINHFFENMLGKTPDQ